MKLVKKYLKKDVESYIGQEVNSFELGFYWTAINDFTWIRDIIEKSSLSRGHYPLIIKIYEVREIRPIEISNIRGCQYLIKWESILKTTPKPEETATLPLSAGTLISVAESLMPVKVVSKTLQSFKTFLKQYGLPIGFAVIMWKTFVGKKTFSLSIFDMPKYLLGAGITLGLLGMSILPKFLKEKGEAK